MLTTDLLRVRLRGTALAPSWVDPHRRDVREVVDDLRGLLEAALAARWSRGQLEAELEARVEHHRSRRLLLGVIRLLLGPAEFVVDSQLSPADVRARVFARAAACGPLALPGDLLGRRTADDVLDELAREMGASRDDLRRALYADLRDEHVLTACPVPSSQELLERYNVALVQGILLRATELHITLARPTVPRVRQLLRHAKFRQLMHRAWREDEDLHLIVDGPASVLQSTSRYGLAMALFFPALLLQDRPWRLQAEIQWGTPATPATLDLSSADGLVAHGADVGAWETPEQQLFRDRWAAMGETGWEMTDDTLPLQLGGRGVVLPDFTFRRDGREAHLDIVGFWRKGYLERRVEGLVRHGPGNLVVAVSRRLGVDTGELEGFSGEVLSFAQILPARDVLAAVERVAR